MGQTTDFLVTLPSSPGATTIDGHPAKSITSKISSLLKWHSNDTPPPGREAIYISLLLKYLNPTLYGQPTCFLCLTTCDSWDAVWIHSNRKHAAEAIWPLDCPECQRMGKKAPLPQVRNLGEWCAHVHEDHAPGEEEPFRCLLGCKTFASIRDLTTHLEKNHHEFGLFITAFLSSSFWQATSPSSSSIILLLIHSSRRAFSSFLYASVTSGGENERVAKVKNGSRVPGVVDLANMAVLEDWPGMRQGGRGIVENLTAAEDYFVQYAIAKEHHLQRLLDKVNVEGLKHTASNIRKGVPCRIPALEHDGSASGEDVVSRQMGGQNCHVDIKFDDGVTWIARIRLEDPVLPPPGVQSYVFLSEIATLEFLAKTSVPAPKVYHYQLQGSANIVGTSYVLMEKMPGKPLDWNEAANDGIDEGSNEEGAVSYSQSRFSIDCLGQGGGTNATNSIQQMIQQYAEQGPTAANHGERTQDALARQMEKWRKFATEAGIDPHEKLLVAKPRSRIKKESTVKTYWKWLYVNLNEATGKWMTEEILRDVANWINGELIPLFGLDTSQKDKSDLFRAQMTLILIIAAATTTRPDALIGNVLYRHVELQIFRPAPGSTTARIGLLDLQHVKKKAAGRMIFGLHEEPTLLHDPVLHMLALALADRAFLNDITSLEQLHSMRVPDEADRIRLPWSEEWMARPVFRPTEASDYGKAISPTKPLAYETARKKFHSFGRATGYCKDLAILRHSTTVGQKTQRDGHRQGNSSTCVAYYMPNFIAADCQAITFGSERQVNLIERMGRLHRYGGAPTKLTEKQRQKMYNHSTLVSCREKRNAFYSELRRQYGQTRYYSKGTELEQQYLHYQNLVKKTKAMLEKNRLDQAIQDFHSTAHAQEVARQLDGEEPDKAALEPSAEHELPDRQLVADLFAGASDATSEEAIRELRVQISLAISRLCLLKQSRVYRGGAGRKVRARCAEGAKGTNESQASTPGAEAPKPKAMAGTWGTTKYACGFCRWGDKSAGKVQRQRTYRVDALAMHWKVHHAAILDAELLLCPYPSCDAAFGNAPFCQRFGRISWVNHVSQVHGIPLGRGWTRDAGPDWRVALGMTSPVFYIRRPVPMLPSTKLFSPSTDTMDQDQDILPHRWLEAFPGIYVAIPRQPQPEDAMNVQVGIITWHTADVAPAFVRTDVQFDVYRLPLQRAAREGWASWSLYFEAYG
ncbi:uncharacterized protein BCR38DRAFT_490448 [Pseudomassariella vexata]|uniref:C2H2-type domain-containing protein n=1 Tax=Pseudomassariella vexata TaxID=1141098 RepID=A0A1Y2DEB5_9PEZI|nr:uncharacterized protein BCR38DRAFT_490448 [Pseudomassariella vexata]ORY57005.1 hypothetical protein BCR38DRAFT_490448 [Pseudomassariella vexata]